MSEMANYETNNGMNGTRTTFSEGVLPGRCPVVKQHRPGRQSATALKKKWNKDENKVAIECYLKSDPTRRGYRKRMHNIWIDKTSINISEQRLADQVNQIKKKGWLTELEIEEIKRKCKSFNCTNTEVNTEVNNDIDFTITESLVITTQEPLQNNNFEIQNSRNNAIPELNDEETALFTRLNEILKEKERKPVNLKHIDRAQLHKVTSKINNLISKLEILDLTRLNAIIYAAGVLVAEILGVKRGKKKRSSKEPWWKRRLERDLLQMNKDYNHLNELIKGNKLKKYIIDNLQRKYNIKKRKLTTIREEVKQRISAKTAKIKRYQNRIKQFQQNQNFKNNEGKFYKTIDSKGDNKTEIPDPENAREFWSSIWSNPKEHNKDAEWLSNVKRELEVTEKQKNIIITTDDMKKFLKRTSNWKAPGPDGVQGFWLKNFTSLHDRIIIELNNLLQQGEVPLWMTKGRTVLIQKDIGKGKVPSNYRPITCLPLMWKLLTGIIASQLYCSLDSRNLLFEEQKGCRKKSKGTHDLLYIDKLILREAKKRQKNLAMGWIDYKKAYDMIPHSWLKECLQMFKIADNINKLLNKSMESWRVELTSNDISLGEVNIKRGIFQGDSLSPLLFIIAMTPLTLVLRKSKHAFQIGRSKEALNHLLYMDDLKLYAKTDKELEGLVQSERIFSNDIGMEFGINKCAVLILKRGKQTFSEGISLPGTGQMKSIGEDEYYKYLGVLEADKINCEEMKSNTRKEYLRRVRKILETKLNSGNLIKAINFKPVNLKHIDRAQLHKVTSKINNLISKLEILDLTRLNAIIYAAGVLVAEILGVKRGKKKRSSKEPWWKRRLERDLLQMNKDYNHLNELIKGNKLKKYIIDNLQRKYNIKKRKLTTIREEVKQRISAKTAKIKRYQNRIKQFQQNQNFKNNEGKFYKTIDSKGDNKTEIPDPENAREFWSSIWSNPKEHNKDAEWLSNVKRELEVTEKQKNIIITTDDMKKFLKRTSNWKAPGPDGVQGFWLKNFTSLHDRIIIELNNLLQQGEVPLWMTKGRTVLIQKDIGKGKVPSNYRPITCLPLMWKLLTGIIASQLYCSLDSRNLLFEEQKGCRKKSKGTHDLLYIDKLILREAKKRQKNLAMGWIDYKKAYDMIPHSWLKECLQMFKIADNINKLLNKSMESWRVELTSNDISLGEVNIKRGIFQGDSLSPLLFIIAMTPLTLVLRKSKHAFQIGRSKEALNHLLYMDDLKLYAKTDKELEGLVQSERIFSNDIGMEFGINKCAVLILKRGKQTFSEGISLPGTGQMKSIGEDEYYKYLGVLEADKINCEEMKSNTRKEYLRRVRKILETKLNSGNLIKAINTWAVSLIRYAAPFIEWTIEEVKNMDRRTRKLLTMHNAYHPKSNVERLYLPRSSGGRGLQSIEDVVQISILGLRHYIRNNNERIIKAVKETDPFNTPEPIETKNEFKKNKIKARSSDFILKTLHGQFFRQTQNLASNESWLWLRHGSLKRETESLILAAQEQAIRTNNIKAKIDKTQNDSKCRMCKSSEETINHIISECPKLAQKEYKRRHDWFGTKIHWEICKKYDIEVNKNWFEHKPEKVTENNYCKILWDFNIQTDHIIEARRPDLVLLDRMVNKCYVVDFAVPFDSRVECKEQEKIEKYQDLVRELKKIWNMPIVMVPLVIGTLGTISKQFKNNLKKIDIQTKLNELQKTVVINTARIIRKVIEI